MHLDANTNSHDAPTSIGTDQTQARAYETPVLEYHGQWTINLGINVGSVRLPE
jgi:hypothetical protein